MNRNDALARGLQADLALARAGIRKLRAERDQQQQQLRRALGARLDDLAKADLHHRVDELTHANTELAAAIEQHRRDNQALQARTTELEDDLAAAHQPAPHDPHRKPPHRGLKLFTPTTGTGRLAEVWAGSGTEVAVLRGHTPATTGTSRTPRRRGPNQAKVIPSETVRRPRGPSRP